MSDQGCGRAGLGTFEFTILPNLITALSKGREPALSSAKGYGEAGGEGLFSSVTMSESLTHRFAVPPLPQAGEGCHPLLFRGQIKCPNSRAPKGRNNVAQGVSPGKRPLIRPSGHPLPLGERGGVRGIHSNPGLTPWAALFRPFGDIGTKISTASKYKGQEQCLNLPRKCRPKRSAGSC